MLKNLIFSIRQVGISGFIDGITIKSLILFGICKFIKYLQRKCWSECNLTYLLLTQPRTKCSAYLNLQSVQSNKPSILHLEFSEHFWHDEQLTTYNLWYILRFVDNFWCDDQITVNTPLQSAVYCI